MLKLYSNKKLKLMCSIWDVQVRCSSETRTQILNRITRQSANDHLRCSRQATLSFGEHSNLWHNRETEPSKLSDRFLMKRFEMIRERVSVKDKPSSYGFKDKTIGRIEQTAFRREGRVAEFPNKTGTKPASKNRTTYVDLIPHGKDTQPKMASSNETQKERVPPQKPHNAHASQPTNHDASLPVTGISPSYKVGSARRTNHYKLMKDISKRKYSTLHQNICLKCNAFSCCSSIRLPLSCEANKAHTHNGSLKRQNKVIMRNCSIWSKDQPDESDDSLEIHTESTRTTIENGLHTAEHSDSSSQVTNIADSTTLSSENHLPQVPQSLVSMKVTAFSLSWAHVHAMTSRGYHVKCWKHVQLCDSRTRRAFHRNSHAALWHLVQTLPMERLYLLEHKYLRPHANSTMLSCQIDAHATEQLLTAFINMRFMLQNQEDHLVLPEIVKRVPEQHTAKFFDLKLGTSTASSYNVMKDIFRDRCSKIPQAVFFDVDLVDNFYQHSESKQQYLNSCLLQAFMYYETMVDKNHTKSATS